MTKATRPVIGATGARVLCDSPVLGPRALRAARDAYALAWAEISPKVPASPLNRQVPQLRLANAVLAVAGDHIEDAQALKTSALKVMTVKLNQANGT
jgi:hypothetical protein